MPAWEKPGELLKSKIRPTQSQRYDPSAVVWVQNTMAVREKSSNHYDGTPGQSTIRKKFVTHKQRKERGVHAASAFDCQIRLEIYDRADVEAG
jgi:hypothetical protein